MSRVRDAVGAWHESAVRLLLPVADRRGRAMPWSAIIPSARLEATTSWASIRHLTDRGLDPPDADLHPGTAQALARALSRETPARCWFALWKGYAEVPQVQQPLPAAPPPRLVSLLGSAVEPLTVPDAAPEDTILLRAPCSWLVRRTRRPGLRAPLLIHAADDAFTVACPMYHDSLYVGGSRALIEQLLQSSVEAFEIRLDAAIPGSGELLD